MTVRTYEWTEVNKNDPETLPSPYHKLLFVAEKQTHFGYFTGKEFSVWHSIGQYRNFDNEVTFWMPLPDAPGFFVEDENECKENANYSR